LPSTSFCSIQSSYSRVAGSDSIPETSIRLQ
jgi:hypothetical protein